VVEAVNYLASIGGEDGNRRDRLVRTMTAIKEYEAGLSEDFLRLATQIPGLKVYGITDIESLGARTPTFAVSLAGYSPEYVAEYLGERGIFVWHGHYYAVAVMERLGTLEAGGLVRIGFVHYNTKEETDRLF
jgi:selenocysteine lyase/cysteine desulfurase